MKGLCSASSDKRVTKSGHTCADTVACFPSQLFFKSSWAKVRITEDLTSGLSNGGVCARNIDSMSLKKCLLVSKIHSWVLLWFYSILLWAWLWCIFQTKANLQKASLDAVKECIGSIEKKHLKPQVLQIEFITILALILLSTRHCRASVKNIFYLPLLLQNQ